jgi:hypothetical protein
MPGKFVLVYYIDSNKQILRFQKDTPGTFYYGQFLSDGRILLIGITLLTQFENYDASIYSDHGEIDTFKNLDQILISPKKDGFIALSRNKLKIYYGNKLKVLEDNLSNKLLRYNCNGNFIVYNSDSLHFYSEAGNLIRMNPIFKFKLAKYEEIMDFKKDVIVKGTRSYFDFIDSISNVQLLNLSTGKTIGKVNVVNLRNVLLSNNANSFITLSINPLKYRQDSKLCNIYSIRSGAVKQINSVIIDQSCIVLDNEHFRPDKTDFYGYNNNSTSLQTPEVDEVITANVSDVQYPKLNLINVRHLKVDFSDRVSSIAPYFESNFPTGKDDKKKIDSFLHANNSLPVRIINKLFSKR